MKHERLTKQNQEPKTIFCFSGSMQDFKIYKRLQELEDKKEQGTLIELPCKVGDTVYMLTQVVVDFVSYEREWRIHKFQIDSIGIDDDGGFFTQGSHKNFYFGRDIFATREEAEKRLKELQE